MGQAGWDVYGIEPSPDAVRKATEVPNAHVRQGILEPDIYDLKTFDAVTLWSVLEHLHNPAQTLQIIRGILKPTGYLHICIPNFGSLERHLFKTYWFGLDIPRHLYHFDPKSAREILTRNGFQIVSLEQASGHDVLKFSIRLKMGLEWSSNSPAKAMSATSSVLPATVGGLRRAKRWVNRNAVNGVTRFADSIGRGSQMLIVAQVA